MDNQLVSFPAGVNLYINLEAEKIVLHFEFQNALFELDISKIAEVAIARGIIFQSMRRDPEEFLNPLESHKKVPV